MNTIDLSKTAEDRLTDLIRQEIFTAVGKKALEFGGVGPSLAKYLYGDLEYIAYTNKTDVYPESLKAAAETEGIYLIPDREIGEDCYFGRFHLVFTVFGFHDLPRLVDEIMRLRRLIIKGGKMVIIDLASDGFEETCIKQLKRCGFTDLNTEALDIDGMAAFRITAVK